MSANSDALSVLLSRFRLQSELFAELSYCGNWRVEPSERHMSTFHLVRSGTCRLHLEDRSALKLKAGNFVMLPRNGRHLISSEPEAGTSVALGGGREASDIASSTEILCGYFEFESRVAAPLLEHLPDLLVLDIDDPGREETARLLQLMVDEAGSERPGRRTVINQLACVLFTHAVRSQLQADGAQGLLAAFADPRIGHSLNRFHVEPELRWSVRKLAEYAGMSRSAFSAQFKSLTGYTPMEYGSDWRMQLAEELLATTEQSVARIAERVGYESEAAFRTAFRKRAGYPPGAVRRASRQALSQ